MNALAILTTCVDDVDGLVLRNKDTLVANLTTHLTIEWSCREYDLEICSFLDSHLTISENLTLILCVVIANELLLAWLEFYPVRILYLCSITSTSLLSLHLLIKLSLINAYALLTADKFGKIERETVGIKQAECLSTVEHVLLLCLESLDSIREHRDTLVESAEE